MLRVGRIWISSSPSTVHLGRCQWIAQASAASADGNDAGYRLDLDTDGNVYLAGSFRGQRDVLFRAETGRQETTPWPVGRGAIFLAKYTFSGTLLWVQTGTSDCGNRGARYMRLRSGSEFRRPALFISRLLLRRIRTFRQRMGRLMLSLALDLAHGTGQVRYERKFPVGRNDSASPNSGGEPSRSTLTTTPTSPAGSRTLLLGSSANGQDITVTGFSPGPVETRTIPAISILAKYDKNGNAMWVNHIGGYKAISKRGRDWPKRRDYSCGLSSGTSTTDRRERPETIVTSQPPGANINLGGGVFTNPYNMDRSRLLPTIRLAYSIRALRRGGPATRAPPEPPTTRDPISTSLEWLW